MSYKLYRQLAAPLSDGKDTELCGLYATLALAKAAATVIDAPCAVMYGDVLVWRSDE